MSALPCFGSPGDLDPGTYHRCQGSVLIGLQKQLDQVLKLMKPKVLKLLQGMCCFDLSSALRDVGARLADSTSTGHAQPSRPQVASLGEPADCRFLEDRQSYLEVHGT